MFLYPADVPDNSQNVMGSKLDQDPFSDYFQEVHTSSICIILLTNKWGKNRQLVRNKYLLGGGKQENNFLSDFLIDDNTIST